MSIATPDYTVVKQEVQRRMTLSFKCFNLLGEDSRNIITKYTI